LLDLIGPIATFLVQKVLKSNPRITAPELVNALASEIPDSQKAAAFYRRLLKE
jgi:serine/threonine-protein kinase